MMGDQLDNAALPGIKLDIIMGRHAGFLTAASMMARTLIFFRESLSPDLAGHPARSPGGRTARWWRLCDLRRTPGIRRRFRGKPSPDPDIPRSPMRHRITP